VRFYGLDPLALLDLPDVIRDSLLKCIDPLVAEESTHAINDNRIAATKQDFYERWMNRLRNKAAPYQPPPVATINPIHEGWFAANGIPYKLNN
jgi:hypothetical protein